MFKKAEKDGVAGCVSRNVLLEIFLTKLYKKPIYIFNDLGEDLILKEEILGLFPTFLHREIDKTVA